jgi:Mg2+/citrate symporter
MIRNIWFYAVVTLAIVVELVQLFYPQLILFCAGFLAGYMLG